MAHTVFGCLSPWHLSFGPDVGPVITRAIARTVGTTVGVGIAAIVAWTGNTVLELIILSCVMAAIQPWAQRRSHTLSVITFTPVVFVFLGLLGRQETSSACALSTRPSAPPSSFWSMFSYGPRRRHCAPPSNSRMLGPRPQRYGDEAEIDNPFDATNCAGQHSGRGECAKSPYPPRALNLGYFGGSIPPAPRNSNASSARSTHTLWTFSTAARTSTPRLATPRLEPREQTEPDPSTLIWPNARVERRALRGRFHHATQYLTGRDRARGPAEALAGVPGNDVMIRLTDANGRLVSRRYSVRRSTPRRTNSPRG